MSSYRFALVVHLFALVAAFGAGAVLHVAMFEVRRARSGADALGRLGVAHRAARVFPIAMLVLVGSGAWMVHRGWTWSAAFVDVGLAAVVFLGVCGDLVGGRRAAVVAGSLAATRDEPPGVVVEDRMWWCATFANTGVALAVVVAMVAKPSLAAAIATVVGGAVVGAAVGEAARHRRTGPVAAASSPG